MLEFLLLQFCRRAERFLALPARFVVSIAGFVLSFARVEPAPAGDFQRRSGSPPRVDPPQRWLHTKLPEIG